MNTETVKYLASKYGVAQRTIRELHRLSLAWQAAITEDMRARTMHLYDGIVAAKCRGIDPLV